MTLDPDFELTSQSNGKSQPDDGAVPRGADLLQELADTLTEYVVLPSREAVVAVVLWIAATHGLPAFEHATRLAINSPVKRCGKSRLQEVIQGLAHSPVATTNISVAALFRMIENAGSNPPTLILDEADRLFGSAKKDEENRELIAILNNGFRDGSPTWRCVGPTQIPMPFSNYAMVAIAGIGRKPDTIEDRAVVITMRRRMPGETIRKFRLRTDVPALNDFRDRLAIWVGSVMERLEVPVTSIPEELEDRAEDAWEPLLAIADAAGGDWPKWARSAAVQLTRTSVDDDEESLEARLLADVRNIFSDCRNPSFLSTSELVTELRKLEESPWMDIDLTGRKLALRLGKFGVKPKHNSAKTARGYRLNELQDSFSRYLPSKPSATVQTTPEQEEPLDESKTLDGSTRPDENIRPQEIPAQKLNGQVRTVWTDPPDGQVPTADNPCPICAHPPVTSGSFGYIACEHQIAAGLAGGEVPE